MTCLKSAISVFLKSGRNLKTMVFIEILEYYHSDGVQQGWCHSFEALHQFSHQVAVKTSFDLKWKRWSRVQLQLSPADLWVSSVKMYICFFDVKCLPVCLNTLKVHFNFIVDKMDLMCSWETVFLTLCERKCIWWEGLPKWIVVKRMNCLQLITDCKRLIISCIEWMLYEVLLQQVKHFKSYENQAYWIYMWSTWRFSYWNKDRLTQQQTEYWHMIFFTVETVLSALSVFRLPPSGIHRW